MKVPQRVQRALQRAEAHLKLGAPAAALPDIEHALQKCPDAFVAWSMLGRAKSLLGDQPGAEAAYQRALTIEGADPATWFNLGVTYSARAMYAEAIPCYLKALARRRTGFDVEAAQNLGSCYLKLDRFDAARDVYLGLLTLSENANLRSLLGMAYLGLGDHASALQAFERSVALGMRPNHTLLASLAACHGALGDEERAEQYRREADALLPAATEDAR